MVHDAQRKRNPGNICAQLLLSACVLLVPPFLMVAGVMYLGSPLEDVGQQMEGERADKRPEHAPMSLALPNAEQRLVVVESVAEGPAATTQKQVVKDSTRYEGLATIRDGSAQSPAVDVKNPQTQTAVVPNLSSDVPEPLPTERRKPPAHSATLDLPGTVVPVEEAQPSSHQNENWVVQLSAQRTEEEAQSAFRAAQAKYAGLASYHMRIRRKDQGRRGVFYAAQVGPLSRDEANGLCSRIKSAGGKCFIQEN